jgi:hypothetical protein
MAAQVRDDHAMPGGGQARRDLGEGVDVIGPAVQQQHHRAVLGAHLDIADVQRAGVDLLDRTEGGLGRGRRGRAGGAGQAAEGGRQGRGAEEAATVRIAEESWRGGRWRHGRNPSVAGIPKAIRPSAERV